jgi:hypothetical protein
MIGESIIITKIYLFVTVRARSNSLDAPLSVETIYVEAGGSRWWPPIPRGFGRLQGFYRPIGAALQ